MGQGGDLQRGPPLFLSSPAVPSASVHFYRGAEGDLKNYKEKKPGSRVPSPGSHCPLPGWAAAPLWVSSPGTSLHPTSLKLSPGSLPGGVALGVPLAVSPTCIHRKKPNLLLPLRPHPSKLLTPLCRVTEIMSPADPRLCSCGFLPFKTAEWEVTAIKEREEKKKKTVNTCEAHKGPSI